MKHLTAAQTFIRTLVKRRLASVKKIGTADNTADLLTKHVLSSVYAKLLPNTGYREMTESERHVHIEKLQPINKLSELQSPKEILSAHEVRMQELAREEALQIAAAGSVPKPLVVVNSDRCLAMQNAAAAASTV